MNITRASLTAALAVGASVLALSACTGTTVSKAPAAPASSAAALPSTFTPPPEPTTPAPVTSGPLGTSFTVTTTDNSGNDVTYEVTLTQFAQHTGLGQYETMNNPADHMAAARFTIKGDTGQASDDANNDATAIGADTSEYQASVNSVTAGGNFNDGDFAAGPGETVSGWVSFEVPPGGTVASVQWSPSSGFGSAHATWTLAS